MSLPSGANTYGYNAFNERVWKQTATLGSTRFVYGPGSTLLAERRESDGQWSDYLWFNGELVGLVRGTALYFVHGDHLGRPELVTDGSGSVAWRASNFAFDRKVTTDGIGGLNVGFPGQYFDQETGTAQNYFRDYDPSHGRYRQSDPIGLEGGLNRHLYVGGAPALNVDPYGLAAAGGTVGGAIGGLIGGGIGGRLGGANGAAAGRALGSRVGASVGSAGLPSANDSACLPAGRVGWVTPSMGRLSSRPVRRHHWCMSLSHLVPAPLRFFTSYQTDRLAATEPSARSSHMAT